MADFRLEDLGNIVLALGMLALFVFGGAILFAATLKYGPALRDYFFERASNRPLGDMLSAMSSGYHSDPSAESRQIAQNQQATTTLQPDNNLIAITQNERNDLLQRGRAQALATLVAAKKVTETDGILIVFGVKPSSSSKRYHEARAALRDELAKLQGPQYRAIDENKQPVLN